MAITIGRVPALAASHPKGDAGRAQTDRAPADTPPIDESTRTRLAPWNPLDRVNSWYWTGAVTLIALILRMVNVQKPGQIVFDETYYAVDAWAILHYGYERNPENTGGGVAAHPPFGKWCIALGEWLFGYNSFGWRFSSAIAGAISVLLLIRIARRLFRSTLLGCIAGGLLAVEGQHFVASRMALLDIFLMLFVFAAFACLVIDRDVRRAQILTTLETGAKLRPGFPRAGWRQWPWGRIAAAVFLGLAFSVKWSALWFALIFIVLMIVWEIQARRSAGANRPFLETVGWETGWLALFLILIVVTYLATWTGWFLSDDAYFRNWAQENNGSVWYLPDALVNLWQYQHFIYEFHAHLDADHPYKSSALNWLVMERPVLYYADSALGCGATECKATISALGTPLLWWSFVPAWLVCVWRWATSRDWRAGAIVLTCAAGIVPWLMYPDRTMFIFYTVPAIPFFILAVTMMLGIILGKPDDQPQRRLIGAGIVAAYLVLIVMTFVYFYPVLTGTSIPLDQWNDRMWFESWK